MTQHNYADDAILAAWEFERAVQAAAEKAKPLDPAGERVRLVYEQDDLSRFGCADALPAILFLCLVVAGAVMVVRALFNF